MTDFTHFDKDTLYNYIWKVVGKKVGYGIDCDVLTDRICDAVMEWVPKQGDFWLNEDDGVIYVNKGWEVVTAEAPEITPEENERRFQETLKFIKGITHEQITELMGEEWLEEFRKVAQ